MSFAVLRVAKIKSAGGAGGLSAHLERTMDVPNADEELRRFNKREKGSGNLWQDIKEQLEKFGITDVRKNGVYAIEILMTASPEHFNFHKVRKEDGSAGISGNIENWKNFNKNCQNWLVSEFGKNNIVNYTIHHDESTPHIHAVIVPVTDSKKTQMVQRKVVDSFGKTIGFQDVEAPIKKLSAKSFIDGRTALRGLQDRFADVHKESGLKRGLEGSKAKHTTVKDFYASIKNNPTAEPETLKLVNQRSMKKETLTEKRLAKLEKIIREDFGERIEWDKGKDTLFLFNIEEERRQKEAEIKAQEEKLQREKEAEIIKQKSNQKTWLPRR
jgi:hypothetical protein